MVAAGGDLGACFDECLVRNASCVLAGMRPAALFNFAPASRGCAACVGADLRREAAGLALGATRRLGALGVRVDMLLARDTRVLVMASRPALVEGVLADPAVREFLSAAGYATDCVPRVVSCLRRRLRGYERGRAALLGGCGTGPGLGASCGEGVPTNDDARREPCDACARRRACNPWRAELGYPHEVGVLLGYPLADVRSFIERHGRGAAAVGAWKTYGDVGTARARWELLRACERASIARYEGGATLEDLAA